MSVCSAIAMNTSTLTGFGKPVRFMFSKERLRGKPLSSRGEDDGDCFERAFEGGGFSIAGKLLLGLFQGVGGLAVFFLLGVDVAAFQVFQFEDKSVLHVRK